MNIPSMDLGPRRLSQQSAGIKSVTIQTDLMREA